MFERLFWSIAFPGFGQLLNRQYLKGILFIFLELFVNIQANFNIAIISSFLGDIHTSIEQIDFQWLMFYPCLYFFSMWDAVKDVSDGKEDSSLLFLPFVFAAYFVTVGVILSTKVKIFGVLLGPIFLPMLFVIPGVVTGLVIKKILTFRSKQKG
ncbi:membrane protein [Bacillus sp. SA1-12]|nr:membrane protein [Bacillus sp. SA1-12]